MYRQMNQLHEYLTESAVNFPNKVALVFGESRLTYHYINSVTDKMAKNFLSHGLLKGDRVLVCLENSIEAVLIFWAVLKAGGVISIINPDLMKSTISFIMKDSGCQFFVSQSKLINELYSENIKIIITDIINFNKSKINNVIIDFNELLSLSNNKSILTNNLDIDLASIIYTSGSTGEPKGVMLTHRNMLSASQSINTYLENNSEDVILSALPLSFDYGLYQMIMAFSIGGRLVLEKNFFLPVQFIRKLTNEKVTALPGVPTLFSILVDTYKKFKFDTESIRYLTNTGAAIYDHQIDNIRNIFKNARFYSMYGLTECKRCTYLPPEDLDRKSASVGIAIPNTEMWIVDDNGARLPPNNLGQLVIRGSTVMKGYWNRPEETAKKLRDGLLPAEKVLYTGDYGLIDEEGYFYFKGRMDESIKSRGVKISPKEIEEVLYGLEEVKEAAVLGIPDNQLGHKIIACIVVSNEVKLDEATVYHFCKTKLEKIKIPHQLIYFSSFPKSQNGKINKKALLDTVINKHSLLEAVNA